MNSDESSNYDAVPNAAPTTTDLIGDESSSLSNSKSYIKELVMKAVLALEVACKNLLILILTH